MPYGPFKAIPAPSRTSTSQTGSSVTDSLTFRITMLVIALFVRLVSVAQDTDNTLRFKSPHHYMIVVPVRIDGTGPYHFLLDTGATSSVVDPQLSRALNLSATRGARLSSWQATTDTRRVLVENLSVGPLNCGPLSVLVQPLSEFKAFDPHLRGILGQDVLLRSNYLIDNRHHLIRFDDDGSLLNELTGDHVTIAPVSTRTGGLEPRLISILVKIDKDPEPLHLVLDSGADMVVLQPRYVSPVTVPKGTKWMADENGATSAATTFHTLLSVGSKTFSAEAWTGDAGLKQLVVDGLLPTGSFDELYIANRGSFVILEPCHAHHSASLLVTQK